MLSNDDISVKIELLISKVDRMDKHLDRVVHRDTFELEKRGIYHDIEDVRKSVMGLRGEIEDESAHRENLARWLTGTVISVGSLAVTLGIAILT